MWKQWRLPHHHESARVELFAGCPRLRTMGIKEAGRTRTGVRKAGGRERMELESSHATDHAMAVDILFRDIESEWAEDRSIRDSSFAFT